MGPPDPSLRSQQLHDSQNLVQRQLILKCMILLYQQCPLRIGQMKMLPYWLRFLQDP